MSRVGAMQDEQVVDLAAAYGWQLHQRGVHALFLITLPLIRPSIVASWILLFSIFMTELSMVILLYTANSRTFSVLTFETWSTGIFSVLAGLSILQLLVGASIMLFVRHLFGSLSPCELINDAL